MMPKPLRIGIWDTAWRTYGLPSITWGRELPPTVEYVDRVSDGVDLIMATYMEMAEMLVVPHAHRVLWLQESPALYPHPAIEAVSDYDIVLTNDLDYLKDLPQGRYVPPIGTWLQTREIPEKTHGISFIAKRHNRAPGHFMRHMVSQICGGVDVYGEIATGEQLPLKDPTLLPYRFQIAIENCRVPGYYTEKLWDCLAAKCVPLYWGSPNLDPLRLFGVDPFGILAWETLDDLVRLVRRLTAEGDAVYANLRAAIEQNYAAAWHYDCGEVYLEHVLRKAFGL